MRDKNYVSYRYRFKQRILWQYMAGWAYESTDYEDTIKIEIQLQERHCIITINLTFH